MKTNLSHCITFASALVVACVAAVAIASTAAVSDVAPMLRPVLQSAPVVVVRLEPVVVTISRTSFDAIRKNGATTEVARSNDLRKATRG